MSRRARFEWLGGMLSSRRAGMSMSRAGMPTRTRACHPSRRRQSRGGRPLVFELLEARQLMAVGAGGLTAVRIEEFEWHALSPAASEHAYDVANMPTVAAATEVMPPGEWGTLAREYVLANRGALGLSQQSDFTMRSAFVGMDDLQHVRLDQTLGGVRVWGADVVVHLAPEDGAVLFVSGNVLADVGLASFDAIVSADQAINVGTFEYASWLNPPSPALPAEGRGPEGTSLLDFSTIPLAFERESAELVVYAGAGDPVLAWHVEFFTDQQAGLEPGLWNFFIDARSGLIVDWFDGLARLEQASGAGGNPKVGDRPWVDALDVEETGTPDLYMMDTARQVTTDLGGATSGTGTVVTGPLDPIGDAAINDAHGFTEITLNMLDEWFGYDSIDNAGFKLVSRVHYGLGSPTAFWDGTQTTYGDGESIFHPLSGAIDTVSHEIHHGFTEFHSGLGYLNAEGALNESFSDVAGTVAEFYAEGLAADFLIGEDIKVIGFVRSMTDPMADGLSFDDAIRFSAGINSHYTSGIGNKAFARTALRFSSGSPTGAPTIEGVRRAGAAWYLANESYWTASSDLTQGGQGVYDAAEALGFSADELLAIRDSWADVGVFFEGGIRPHDETLTAESGTLTSPNFPSNYPHNYKHTWAIDPAGDALVTLAFSSFQVLGSVSDVVEVRDGAGTLLSRTSSSVLPPPATATRLLVTFATSQSGSASGWSATWTSAALPELSGDYNEDGRVDAGDYVRWRNNLGDVDEADINYNGDGGGVTADDYAWWKQHYGEPGMGGGGVAISDFGFRISDSGSQSEKVEGGRGSVDVFGAPNVLMSISREATVRGVQTANHATVSRDDALEAWLATRSVGARREMSDGNDEWLRHESQDDVESGETVAALDVAFGSLGG